MPLSNKTANDGVPASALVAMSGGVDSSVAAAVLAENGVAVTGVTFRLPFFGDSDGREEKCCGVRGIEDARRVCRRIGIKHYVLDYRDKFKQTVLDDFFCEYRAGRTPNPCVRCNDWLKFGALLETAEAMGIRYVATGHYVHSRHNTESGRYELLVGPEGEDQSYFLFSLSQHQLAHALFPLGDLTKAQVRAKARRTGLRIHNKPKSQDLCFIPDGGYEKLIARVCPDMLAPGDVLHVSGEKIGSHRGIAFYTVGQRKGLGIAWREPLYVVEIDSAGNRLIVGEKKYTLRKQITVGDVNWIALPPQTEGSAPATVKIRFRHPPAAAILMRQEDGRVNVEFDHPQAAPAPGQSAVFYEGGRVLGGGFIEQGPQ